MSCDFSTYNSLRDQTATKAGAASTACTALTDAEAALAAAQADVNAKTADKQLAYSEWEAAEQAENAEAAALGIAPCPSPPEA